MLANVKGEYFVMEYMLGIIDFLCLISKFGMLRARCGGTKAPPYCQTGASASSAQRVTEGLQTISISVDPIIRHNQRL